MSIVILGIDLGKNSCSVAGLDASGRVVLRRRLRRQTIAGFARQWRGCIVARWRPAAVRITWGGSLWRRATRCG